jgi:hypothetical protein
MAGDKSQVSERQQAAKKHQSDKRLSFDMINNDQQSASTRHASNSAKMETNRVLNLNKRAQSREEFVKQYFIA